MATRLRNLARITRFIFHLSNKRFIKQVAEVKRTVTVERFYAFCQTERMSPAPVKPLIEPTLLEQLDVRVGTIEAVGAVPGSDKLVQLRVQFGDHLRIIVAGMKQERTDPREIEGKQALFVINLPPKKLRGVVSEGMLFDIGYADGITPVLAMPESHVPDGTRVG